ncbi:MAG: hypothetical protein AAGA85_21560 [Bacteroidota bacterium]
MQDKLLTIAEAEALIKKERLLVIFGEEALLTALPQGNWIGGTMPYFYLKGTKGVFDQEHVFVTDFTDYAKEWTVKSYGADDIKNIAVQGFDNGFQFTIIPAYQPVHQEFAVNADSYDKLYDNPVIGLVAGVSLEDLSNGRLTKTFNGLTGEVFIEKAVTLHIGLQDHQVARLEIVNIFGQDHSDDVVIEPIETSFKQTDCLINGEKKNLYDYLIEHDIDTKYPLVCDYAGAGINASFEFLKADERAVTFYAPLFKGYKYKFSKKAAVSYAEAFRERVEQLEDRNNMIFNCNCILNYMYGDLENHDIGYSGPAAFGEIAYSLVNQTFTYLVIDQ